MYQSPARRRPRHENSPRQQTWFHQLGARSASGISISRLFFFGCKCRPEFSNQLDPTASLSIYISHWSNNKTNRHSCNPIEFRHPLHIFRPAPGLEGVKPWNKTQKNVRIPYDSEGDLLSKSVHYSSPKANSSRLRLTESAVDLLPLAGSDPVIQGSRNTRNKSMLKFKEKNKQNENQRRRKMS